ncbi:MAG: hypothetical protein EON58_23040 [Alphaproteobacteria bacterium]|nr:MAG: hypothetical protein EON58_23040 [Alphaproteobacteria bacterium]
MEHLFIGELLKASWKSGRYIEVSRPEADRSGYDVILERGDVIRHVQLKTRKSDGEARKQNVHTLLGEKASGCVVVILFDDELRLGPFLYFGSAPGDPLPAMTAMPVAKHTKRNKEGNRSDRPALREVSHKHFLEVNGIADIMERLFGA